MARLAPPQDTIPTPAATERERPREPAATPEPCAAFAWTDPQRMSGTPCFLGTRVPLKHLFDYLEAGETLASFLDDFEGVPRPFALAALESAYRTLVAGLPAA